MKRIAVFTSGGDAPGMNAAIRAVVRAGIYNGLEVLGIQRGYQGMINGEAVNMQLRSVSNILKAGGTILKTSRCIEFETPEGRDKAARYLNSQGIDGLAAIGGNGTMTGLIEFQRHWDGKVIALPGTIDNDIYGTDYTIGFHTAVETAMDAIDKIKDTAAAHERIFIVEVMGRDAGFIALDVGIGGGAETLLIPEIDFDMQQCTTQILEGKEKGKTSSIIIVAEGSKLGGAHDIAVKIKKMCDIECRVVVVGHVQRGGSPVLYDRILASKLGVFAVEMLLGGVTGVMAGEVNNKCTLTPLKDAVYKKKPVDPYKLSVFSILSI
ncbi:MAG: 6-phosphofructokinase [Nitrospirae bacterium]|nr:6-phosphofructokinase [Nitrospirota bacterium]